MKNNIAIVSAPFYREINQGLFHGANQAIEQAGYQAQSFEVPGALELPLACQLLATSGNFAAIVALGCVIRGETAHFDHVCQQSAGGLMQVSLQHNIPIGNGVITVENGEQAQARSAINGKHGKQNKGKEAAEAALSLLQLKRKLNP